MKGAEGRTPSNGIRYPSTVTGVVVIHWYIRKQSTGTGCYLRTLGPSVFTGENRGTQRSRVVRVRNWLWVDYEQQYLARRANKVQVEGWSTSGEPSSWYVKVGMEIFNRVLNGVSCIDDFTKDILCTYSLTKEETSVSFSDVLTLFPYVIRTQESQTGLIF